MEMKKILPKTKSLATLILTIMLVATMPLTLLTPTAYAATTITLSPTSGPCGTVVSVTGTGYTENLAALTLTFGGIPITNTWTTTSTGAIITGSTFTVPSTTPGTYTVIVSDAAGNSASATFTITAVTLTIYPTSGPTGNTILVSATGFLPESTISTATFGVADVKSSLSSLAVDEDGAIYVTFPSASLTAPTTYPSSKSVVLTDSSGNRGTATFSLTRPSITLSPTSGKFGRLVTVTGSGFKPGGTIIIKWDTTSQTTFPTTITATSAGTFTAKFTITSSVAAENLVGAHTVYAYDGASTTVTNVASATFTVTPSITVYMGATATSSTTNYVPVSTGSSFVTVTGSGFAASSALTFTFAGPATPTNTFAATTSTAAGALSVSSTLATWPSTAGTYSLTITDAQDNSASATIVTNADGSFWVLDPTSGPVGTTVTATYFGATSSGNLEASTDASAEWATDPLYPYTYGNVAKLYQLGDTDQEYAYVRVYPYTDLTLSDLTTAANIPTFKYYVGAGSYPPALELHFEEAGGDGWVDVTVYAYGPVTPVWPTTTGIWYDTASTSPNYKLTTGHYAVAYGEESDGTDIAINLGSNPLSAIIAQIVALDSSADDWVLTRVTPQVGWQAVGPQTVYIDDVKIDGVTYPLEPSDIKVGSTSTGLTDGPIAGAYPTLHARTFTVPNVLPGVYTVTGTNGFSTMNAATFTVTTATPTITLSPTSGPKLGGPVTITWSGFISGATITYTFAGTTFTPTYASISKGIATFDVPSYIVGANTVTLSDGTNTASATFTITAPSVTLVSTTIKSKTTMIKANFTGFDQSVDISTFTIGGTSVTALVPTSTDAAGKAYCTFTSPDTVTGGSKTLVVTDASGNTYSQTVTAVPKITLTPKAGVVGTEVTLTGWGFGASKTATMTIGTTSVTLYTGTTAGVTTTAAGAIPGSVTFTVPSTLTTGAYTVTVTDATYPANTATATFTVSAPEFTMTPSSGSAGITVTVTGAGWIPSITNLGWIKFDTTTVYTNGDTDTYGRLDPLAGWTFTVPAVAAGSHTVTVSDGTLEKTATFTVITPSITLSATSGKVADTITITGSGFNPTATITYTSATVGNVWFGTSAVPLASTNTVTAVASDGTLGTGVKIAVPTGSVAGNYTIKLKFTGLEVSQTFTVIPKITVSSTTGYLKGSAITVTGTGFAASKDITVTLANTTIVLSATATSSTGTISGTYALPVDQPTGASILIVTDAAGNSASKTITVGVPTVTLSPSSGAAGTTVQVTGSGFFPAAVTYIIAFDGVVQTTSPPSLTSSTGSTIGFFAVPTTAAAGVHTVALTDTNGNTASATFTVTTVAAAAVDSATLSSTAGTVNPTTGTAQTSFARGTSAKIDFVLQTTTGTANVIWKITFQQPDLSVYNIVTTSASASTTPSTMSMEQLLPSTAQIGTWTATVQIFASDGATPLAVTTVTFAVTAS
jgi:hypothetical protein